MGDLVGSGDAIQTDSGKFALDETDRKLIKILGFTSNVVMWQTQEYETTNKFIYQLWQNDKSLGRGDVYGDPQKQTPYCTHSKQHWDDYSEDFGHNYKQFWFLKRIDGVEYSTGDLTDPKVVKIFNKMKGTGPDTIIAMNDSGNDMLNKYDNHVRNWEYALTNGDSPALDIEYADDIVDLS